MAVSTGNTIQDNDINDAVDIVQGVLGNGSGQTGYGQLCESYRRDNTNTIDHNEYVKLVNDINKCKLHQNNQTISVTTPSSTKIIGADGTGDSVTFTRDVDGNVTAVSIDSVDTAGGVNDIYAQVNNIALATNIVKVHSDHYTATTGRAFGQSETNQSWGGTGSLSQFLVYEFRVMFPGGYNVTNSSTGATEVALPQDHRRHFFNAGGEIRLTGQVVGTSSKATDWALMLSGMGEVRFTKNSTECNSGRPANGSSDADGDGTIDSALGNYQLNTSYRTIYQRNGGDEAAEYAENLIQIRAKRGTENIDGTDYECIFFKVELFDNDQGDGTPTGTAAEQAQATPPVDENVVGTTRFGVDLLRPSGSAVSVPEPVYDEIEDLDII